MTGAVEHSDGRIERMADIRPDLAYDPSNRRLLGGTVRVTLEDGTERTFELEVPTATGFHLGAGLYFGWQGHHHGEWRGELHVDGERLEDCRQPAIWPVSSTSCGTPSSIVHEPAVGGAGMGQLPADDHRRPSPIGGWTRTSSFW